MIRPRVGVAGISFVHDAPGKEEKLVECVSFEVAQKCMQYGAQYFHRARADGYFDRDTVLTILRQEEGK